MSTKKKILIIACAVLALAVIGGGLYYILIALPQKQAQEEQMRRVREYYEQKLTLYQEENNQYADYEVDVAFLGDSLTDGCDLEKYYPQYKTANRGIGGETTIGLEERLQVSVYDLKPKVVVMLIGGNNLDTMFSNYEDILQGLQSNLPQTKIVLVSLSAMGKDWAHKNLLAAYNNVKIRKLAESYGVEFVDIFSLLLDEKTNEIRAEYTTDGAHFTAKGYEVVTGAITQGIEIAMADYQQ